jgi:anti-sigma28 factor (negative regulator of flagellin synthesis)
MRVNDPNLNPVAANPSGPNGAKGAGPATRTVQLDPVRIPTTGSSPTTAGDIGDEVNLSNLSSKINELQSGSPAREAYLEQLRQQVLSGTYEADPQATAAALIRDAFLKDG